MNKAAVARVPLSFSSLDEVQQRLDLLSQNGYDKAGNWNLAQVCEHLRDWMLYMIDGYPKAPLPISWMLWAIRVSVGRAMLAKILSTGNMSSGRPTLQQTVHAVEEFDDANAVRRLKEVIGRFQSHRGPYCPSPLFGQFNAEDGLRLQLIHCAHHLSFLVPK
jgi:Protein of unknown function (DUF1569)